MLNPRRIFFESLIVNDLEKLKKGYDSIIADRSDPMLDECMDRVYTKELFKRD